MSSKIAAIADAVTAALNAGAAGIEGAAVRVYQPKFDLPELVDLKVSVMPGPYDRERVSRTGVLKTYTVAVMLQKQVTAETNAEIDPLMAVAEQVADTIGAGEIGSTGAHWLRTEHDPIYDPEHMRDHRVFTNVISFFFQYA